MAWELRRGRRPLAVSGHMAFVQERMDLGAKLCAVVLVGVLAWALVVALSFEGP